jgi:hypothetical protein
MHAIAERRDELDDFLCSIDEHAIDAVFQPIVDLRHGVADDGASASTGVHHEQEHRPG